ncbi:FHA domain-containing protein [Chloroflexota bacterium]
MTAIIFLVLRIILSICLYLILFLFIYFLWRENYKLGFSISQRRIPTLSLSLISENELIKTKGFNSQDITIGRSSSCDWQIQDEVVSNFHSRFIYHHKQWWVEDLKSKNGTYINTLKVEIPTVLTSGDTISIGNNQFQVSILEEVNPATPRGNITNEDNYD